MTTYATAREAIRSAIVAASGLDTAAVVWGNAGQPISDPVIRLFVSSDVDIVPTREVLTAAGSDYTRAVSTIREWTVQVRAETVATATSSDALNVSGQIRLGMHLQAAQALLAAQGVVLVRRAGPSVDLAFEHGDLLIAARTFDYVFRAVFNLDDPTGIGTIEHAEVGGALTNPAVTIPDETIPEIED